jgi:Glycogen recognition site of AMP-activated protein kinase
MGQNSSSEQGDKPHRAGSRSGTPQQDKKVNRRISVQKLQSKGPTAADPSVSTTSATAQNISQPHGQRAALQNAITPKTTSPDTVSQTSSVERSTSRSSPSNARQYELAQRPRPTQPIPTASPSVPMDVPTSRSRQSDYLEEEEYGRSRETYAPVSVLRPPRLPLPIADVPMPDSPTLEPQVFNNADVSIFEAEESPIGDRDFRRQNSMLSNDTQDDDEIGDELQPYAAQITTQVVPTVIAWKSDGSKVYVTGTFANWERKFRLHPR